MVLLILEHHFYEIIIHGKKRDEGGDKMENKNCHLPCFILSQDRVAVTIYCGCGLGSYSPNHYGDIFI